jgi:hypothetical protein
MSEDNQGSILASSCITFKQGQDSLLGEKDKLEDGLSKIKNKLSDLSNIKNLHFLLGAGASSDSIPAMAELLKVVEKKVNDEQVGDAWDEISIDFDHKELIALYDKAKIYWAHCILIKLISEVLVKLTCLTII